MADTSKQDPKQDQTQEEDELVYHDIGNPDISEEQPPTEQPMDEEEETR